MNLENQADDDKAEGGPAAPQAPSANLAPPLPPPAPVSASGTKPILPPAANAPPIPPVAEHSESGEEADASEYEETDGEETSEEETDGDTGGEEETDSGEEDEDEETSSDEDYSDDDDEGTEGYRPGGYHPVKLGEVYNSKYLVLKKLGWGHFSTVWLVRDSTNGTHVALKVQKSAEHYTEAAYDEIELLKAVQKGARKVGATSVPVCILLDNFTHAGPHGKHVAMVFEALGENLLSLIKRYNYTGIPMPIVRHISRQVAEGLDFLHRTCKIIHTDLKPENILLAKPPDHMELKRISAVGSANPVGGTQGAGGSDKKTKADNDSVPNSVKGLSQKAEEISQLLANPNLRTEERKKLKKKLKRQKQKDKKKLKKIEEQSADQEKFLSTDNLPTANEKDDNLSKMSMDALTIELDNIAATTAAPSGLPGTKTPRGAVVDSDDPCVLNVYAPNFNLDSCGTGEPISFEWNKMTMSTEEWTPIPQKDQCKCQFVTSHETLVKALGIPSNETGSAGKSNATDDMWYVEVQHRDDESPEGVARFSITCEGLDNANILDICMTCDLDVFEFEDDEPGEGDEGDGRAMVWNITFQTSRALIVLGYLEAKVDDLVFLRCKNFQPSADSKVMQSYDALCAAMFDGFKIDGAFDGAVMGVAMCPDTPLTADGAKRLSVATRTETGDAPTAVAPAPQASAPTPAPAASTDGSATTTPPPLPSVEGASGSEEVTRGREKMPQVMIFHLDKRLEGWPKTLVVSPTAAGGVAGETAASGNEENENIEAHGNAVGAEHHAKGENKNVGDFVPAEEEPIELSSFDAKIVDLGNACWTHKHFAEDIQTRQYRCPEVIVGAEYDTSADIWSFACLVFELATGDLLFDPRASELNEYDRDEDHLAQMVELLGKIPKKVAMSGKYSKNFFRKGELKHIKDLRFWGIESVLVEKYHFEIDDAKALADFLKPLLQFNPTRRATAQQALQHVFLDMNNPTGLAPQENQGGETAPPPPMVPPTSPLVAKASVSNEKSDSVGVVNKALAGAESEPGNEIESAIV
jgi:serine/threonine protein kinase